MASHCYITNYFWTRTGAKKADCICLLLQFAFGFHASIIFMRNVLLPWNALKENPLCNRLLFSCSTIKSFLLNRGSRYCPASIIANEPISSNLGNYTPTKLQSFFFTAIYYTSKSVHIDIVGAWLQHHQHTPVHTSSSLYKNIAWVTISYLEYTLCQSPQQCSTLSALLGVSTSTTIFVFRKKPFLYLWQGISCSSSWRCNCVSS